MQAVPGRHMVRSKHLATPQTRPTDLTADDVRALTGSVETFTGYWRIKATRAPGPDAGSGAARWAYLYLGRAAERGCRSAARDNPPSYGIQSVHS